MRENYDNPALTSNIVPAAPLVSFIHTVITLKKSLVDRRRQPFCNRCNMSFSVVRNAVRLPGSVQRWSSTVASAPSTSKPQPARTRPEQPLPPAKMRALVELYHSSVRFVTPETLDADIDLAFIHSKVGGIQSTEKGGPNYFQLRAMASALRSEPKLVGAHATSNASTATLNATASSPKLFSLGSAEREIQLERALFGATLGRPGYEALVEEADRIREHQSRDKKEQPS